MPARKNLLTIKNHRREAPDLPDLDGAYVGYFRNEHGEQAIFVAQPGVKVATLYHGDDLCGPWDPTPVGKPLSKAAQKRIERLMEKAPGVGLTDLAFATDPVVPIILSSAEYLWIKACWEASRPLREGARNV